MNTNLIIKKINNYKKISSIIPEQFLNSRPYIFNFTKNNKELSKINFENINEFTNYINKILSENNCIFGMGGYAENRIIYRHSNLFGKKNKQRSVHLGVDLWLPRHTEIFSPLDGVIHSFKDNNNYGDYGPTIILQHNLNKIIFYTLYGHLSRQSLENIKVGQKIKSGQKIATVGNYSENGNWPSHLHFQIISDMLGKAGDFPGVCLASEKEYYLGLCPDPRLILSKFLRKA